MSAQFLAAISSKAFTRILAAVKTSSNPVKSNPYFNNCLTNVSANDSRDAATQFMYLLLRCQSLEVSKEKVRGTAPNRRVLYQTKIKRVRRKESHAMVCKSEVTRGTLQ